MKKILALVLAGATALAASAQTFRPNAVSGAVLGGIAGAVIGNNSGSGNGGKGALIGAAAGAVLGAVADDANRSTWDGGARGGTRFGYGHHDYGHRRVAYRPHPFYRPSYPAWPVGAYRYYSYPAYSYGYPSYDYGYYSGGEGALGGALIGAGLGAIIGNNTGSGNGARGALWGALAGAVIGSTRDYAYYDRGYRHRPYRRVRAASYWDTQPEVVYVSSPAQQQVQQQPQQVTIINNYYGNSSPMSSANSLFGR